MSEPRSENRRHYESLRNLLSVNGFDPEIACEDEEYGIGISFPEGVHGPSPEVAKRLINMAMGKGPNGEEPPPTCRHCGRYIEERQGRRKAYWLHSDNKVVECHPRTNAEPLAGAYFGRSQGSAKLASDSAQSGREAR